MTQLTGSPPKHQELRWGSQGVVQEDGMEKREASKVNRDHQNLLSPTKGIFARQLLCLFLRLWVHG